MGAGGFEKALMSQLDPFVQRHCRIIKSERKIKVGFLRMRIGGQIKTLYVKQHNALSTGHRVASLFWPSAALRSFSGALTLLEAGYATAKPVAAVEYRNSGVLLKSLYFAEEIAGAYNVDRFWQEHLAALRGFDGYRERRAFLRALADLFSSLHAKRIYHNDLKAANILVRENEAPPQGSFNVIDLQGLRRCFYVSKRRRIKNLAQLNRTLGRLLSNTEKLFFLKSYRGLSWSRTIDNKAFIQNILAETRRQIARKRSRLRLSGYRSADAWPLARHPRLCLEPCMQKIVKATSNTVLGHCFTKFLSSTSLQKKIYAFIFGQRMLMDESGLHGSEIMKIKPGSIIRIKSQERHEHRWGDSHP
jgi:tRNA A-37 threonylcarbamoyl transferase component Bud32